MKQLVACIALTAIIGTTSSFAQRFAFVDMQYILEQMPEYEKAQDQLDAVAADWQKEVEAQMKEVDDLYKKFQAEQVLMTDQMKTQKIQEIEQKEKAVKEFQKQKFGPNGELFEKRKELIKPIQDRIYAEIKKYAEEKRYDFILDKGSVTMLFLNPSSTYDKSEDILKRL